MKYFVIQGMLKNSDEMTDTIMKEHIAYTQKVMDAGQILMSGLKGDMSGGLFLMKAESLEEVEQYLHNEAFYKGGIQEYAITEFMPHYCNENPKEWFDNAQ